MAQEIPGFVGNQYSRGTPEYEEHRYQYGFSSHTDRVNPALIAYPRDVSDVTKAILFAKRHGIAVALRTGGHQYSAASSTIGDNIQLDLSNTFLELEDQGNARVRVGISFSLSKFNRKLGKLGYFVPHGQCCHVHVGGHAQTGGYGQLGRSFGLFGDHIVAIEIVDANGEPQTLVRGEGSRDQQDLFYAILGGSPGNFAVLTHLTIQAHRDEDHPHSRGLKFACVYSKALVKQFLDIKVEMANDADFPRDLDYCVTVLGSTPFSIFSNLGMDAEFKKEHPDLFSGRATTGNLIWPTNMIVIYLQWANTGGKAQNKRSVDFKNAMQWFDRIHGVARKASPVGTFFLTSFDGSKARPMSQLTKDWIYTNVREFELPYEKRTYMTASTTLVEDKWSKWCAQRIDEAMQDSDLKLSIQIQNFGGRNSMFFRNGQAGDTAYSWRDSTICCVMDCFYKKGARAKALKWQAENDKCVLPGSGVFSKQDRRVLWGSYGNYDLHATRLNYHESEEKYERLRRIKRRVDPDGVFVPNTFCVGWVDYPARGPAPPAALMGVAGLPVSPPEDFDEEAMVDSLLRRKDRAQPETDRVEEREEELVVEPASSSSSSRPVRASTRATPTPVTLSARGAKRRAPSSPSATAPAKRKSLRK